VVCTAAAWGAPPLPIPTDIFRAGVSDAIGQERRFSCGEACVPTSAAAAGPVEGGHRRLAGMGAVMFSMNGTMGNAKLSQCTKRSRSGPGIRCADLTTPYHEVCD
jgi:hypothetical protein